LDLQELITRGRFIFRGAEARLTVFTLVDGRRSAKAIAKRVRRSHSSVLHDLKKLVDVGLIDSKLDKDGKRTRIDDSTVYQKVPLIRHVPISYFRDTTTAARQLAKASRARPPSKGGTKARPLRMPTTQEALDIFKQGEDEEYEFKGPGTDVRTVTKEVAAFLHSRTGGIIFYGVRDDGTIAGTDLRRADLDQRLHNSLRNTVRPAASIRVRSVDALGTEVLAVVVPPWNRRDVYYYEKRVYVRKGTNVFEATPEEIRKLHDGRHLPRSAVRAAMRRSIVHP